MLGKEREWNMENIKWKQASILEKVKLWGPEKHEQFSLTKVLLSCSPELYQFSTSATSFQCTFTGHLIFKNT